MVEFFSTKFSLGLGSLNIRKRHSCQAQINQMIPLFGKGCKLLGLRLNLVLEDGTR